MMTTVAALQLSSSYADIPFELPELLRIERIIPADIDEYLHSSIELEEGLQSGRSSLRSE